MFAGWGLEAEAGEVEAESVRNKNQVCLLRKGVLEPEESLLLEINKKNVEMKGCWRRQPKYAERKRGWEQQC